MWEQRLFETESVKEQDRPLQLRVYGGYRYDSNLFRLSDDANVQSTLGTSDKSDNIYQLGVGGRVVLQESRQKFLIDGSVSHYWYQNFSSLDNTADSLRGEWDWRAGNQWSGTLGAGYRRYLDSFSNIQQDIKDMVSRQRAYGSANYRVASYLKVTVDGEWLDVDHDAESRQTLSYRSGSEAVTVSWVTPSENSLGVRFKRTDARYPNSTPGAAGSFGNEYTDNEYSLVAMWQATAASKFSGRLGYTKREFDQASQRDFRGSTWRFAYDWEPTDKTALQLAVWRELYGFEDVSGGYLRATGVGFFPAWSVTPKLVLQAKAQYQQLDYFGDALLVANTGQRKDQERLYQLAAVWTPLRLTKFIFAVETGNRNSNQSLGDYDYRSVGVSAIRTF